MLTSKNLADRTYEEQLAEAMVNIPLISSEWTNYNPSDPGITILENLTAFETAQMGSINEVTPQIRKMLLKMMGFEAKKGHCARIILGAEGLENHVVIPPNTGFMLGDIRYETIKNTSLYNYRLTGVYNKKADEEYREFPFLIASDVDVSFKIFGEKPVKGDALYFETNGLPSPGETVIMYINVADSGKRNAFEEWGKNSFANIRWECYTRNGFEQIKVRDYTACFMTNGEIYLQLPETPAAPYVDGPISGYVIRAVLEYADYDMSPRISNISAFLFEVWQKETKSACFTFQKNTRVKISNQIATYGYIHVYGKEQKGSAYRKYDIRPNDDAIGRFYEIEEADESRGIFKFVFKKNECGYGPELLKDAVRIVVYDEQMMRNYYLDEVYGYDNQIIKLPVSNIVPEGFCIIAMRKDDNGEAIYNFVRPNYSEEDGLVYRLLEDEGTIVIEDAGAFIGAKLYIGSISVTKGADGNVRAGNKLKGEGFGSRVSFYNPGCGTGGRFRESFQDVKKRFLEDQNKPYMAVLPEDYERIVMETPELCIDRVKAFPVNNTATVRLVVKPDLDTKFPVLSKTYREILRKRIESRRLLSTRVEIVSPMYLPVDINATICVKRRYGDVTGIIEEALRNFLDYTETGKNFGDILRFDDVFRMLESQEAVEYVQDLSLHLSGTGGGKVVDGDVVPDYNCLIYAGRINLEQRKAEREL